MFSICEKCGYNVNQVINSRVRDRFLYRRRECVKCKHRFSTFEITEKEYRRIKEIETGFIEQIRKYVERLPADEQAKFLDEIIK